MKKKKNLTQNKSQTHCARAYEVTSFLSTDCELSTETYIVMAWASVRGHSTSSLTTCKREMHFFQEI